MNGGRLRGITGAIAIVVSLTAASPALAQSSASGVAQSLFEEGVRLMREKKYAEACPKLAESHRLEPAGGTIMNLAVCREQEGKLASAYVAYNEALSRAQKDNNKTRAQTAEQRMNALRPKLSRVVVSVAKPEGDPKIEVRFDDTPLTEEAWGVAFYADVGAHTIKAEAPGYKAFRAELKVDAPGQHYAMNVPPLEKDASVATAPIAPPPAPVAPEKSHEPAANTAVQVEPKGRGALPWILVGTGAALLGAGAVTGVLAISKHDESDRECPDGRCTAQGVDAENQANTFAWVANITIPVGVLAAAAGTYLLIKSPSPSHTTGRARIAPTTSGVVLYGAF